MSSYLFVIAEECHLVLLRAAKSRLGQRASPNQPARLALDEVLDAIGLEVWPMLHEYALFTKQQTLDLTPDSVNS